MSFNFSLVITHPDTEYLIFNPDFINAEVGNTGYHSAYLDTLTQLGIELAQKITAGDTDGVFTLITDDPSVCVIERKWASLEACQSWIQTVLSVHSSTGAPAPTQAKVINLLTQEETIIYPV